MLPSIETLWSENTMAGLKYGVFIKYIKLNAFDNPSPIRPQLAKDFLDIPAKNQPRHASCC